MLLHNDFETFPVHQNNNIKIMNFAADAKIIIKEIDLISLTGSFILRNLKELMV